MKNYFTKCSIVIAILSSIISFLYLDHLLTAVWGMFDNYWVIFILICLWFMASLFAGIDYGRTKNKKLIFLLVYCGINYCIYFWFIILVPLSFITMIMYSLGPL